MGCCYSCKEDTSSQGGEPTEHSRLLVDPVSNNTSIQRVHSDDFEAAYPNSLPKKKTDEQSALNRILQETATNVIDVAGLGAHTLEQHEYAERMKHYSLRLQGVAARSSLARRQPCLLVDIPAPDRALAGPPALTPDIHQIMSVCEAATTALTSLQVEHKEDLVVPFRIP